MELTMLLEILLHLAVLFITQRLVYIHPILLAIPVLIGFLLHQKELMAVKVPLVLLDQQAFKDLLVEVAQLVAQARLDLKVPQVLLDQLVSKARLGLKDLLAEAARQAARDRLDRLDLKV
jgi:hypothetical protein